MDPPGVTPFGVWLPQVTILRTRRLSEAQNAVEAIRQRHCVLLQLEDTEPAEAQRIVDFMAGAVNALDGQVERIGECTFLFAPAGVTVSHN
ncbi:MAG: cell division protein SepF [Cyanobacteria bacterium K_DeepCast_35m_m1_288]|nr:cell division protein SepF [Cyanobacteria bacterium K_DeepCast_35m_m1_288]